MKPWSPELTRSGDGLRLTVLKERLLREHLKEAVEPSLDRLLRLAASEAEALAWQTPVPLLVMPTLLEEKLNTVRLYSDRQRHLLCRQPTAGRRPGSALAVPPPDPVPTLLLDSIR